MPDCIVGPLEWSDRIEGHLHAENLEFLYTTVHMRFVFLLCKRKPKDALHHEYAEDKGTSGNFSPAFNAHLCEIRKENNVKNAVC